MIDYKDDLIKLDHLGDLGMSEMIGLMRLHVQEVTRFTTLLLFHLELSDSLAEQFAADLRRYDVDPESFLIRRESQPVTLSPLGLFLLKICAKVHDIGKPFFRAIYSHERSLTEEEFELQKLHANLTRVIVRSWAVNEAYEFSHPGLVKLVADMAADHQEKFDGRGYPDGKAAQQITVGGRLLAITDAISALMNQRPYQQAVSLECCMGRLKLGEGSHFDPDLLSPILIHLDSECHNSERLSGHWHDTDSFSADYFDFIKNIDFSEAVLHAGDVKQRKRLQAVVEEVLQRGVGSCPVVL
jgi:response regulator RpfG family c-di-GMP phosphodiesterase